ncbi:MAG TPA: hypothetical protein VGB98_15170, partial [Pyrinomonadaceae bacterium]
YASRMELRKHMPAALHSLIHRASISTYYTYKNRTNKVTRIQLSASEEAQIEGFISVEDFWRVVAGKVPPSGVRDLLKQRSLF